MIKRLTQEEARKIKVGDTVYSQISTRLNKETGKREKLPREKGIVKATTGSRISKRFHIEWESGRTTTSSTYDYLYIEVDEKEEILKNIEKHEKALKVLYTKLEELS